MTQQSTMSACVPPRTMGQTFAELEQLEEVERLVGRGAKVMLYRSSRPIPPANLDTRQMETLNELLDRYKERGLLGQFVDVNELREMVNKRSLP